MRVCVIGAGVIGCSTAYELQRSGHQVTVVDTAEGPGHGASFANGGQLSYSYVEPLANPDTLRALPGYFFKSESPVRFRLRWDPAQWAWGLRFLLACRQGEARRGTRELLDLGRASRVTLESWLANGVLDFNFARNGKLVLCPTQAVLDRQARQVELQAHAGIMQEVLDRDACLRIEPALRSNPHFVGGIWTPSDCVGDAFLYCSGLMKASVRLGAVARFRTEVRGFVMREGRARAIATTTGDVEADAFVLCTGMGSVRVARSLGEHLPLYPIKGYSLTLDIKDTSLAPKASVTDLARKMVLAPLGGRLRVAAMAELVGSDTSVPAERIEEMTRAVEIIYPGLCNLGRIESWAGLRPATPRSVPIIRRSKIANVILNVGHGALGFTLAAGSATRVAQFLGGVALSATARTWVPSPST